MKTNKRLPMYILQLLAISIFVMATVGLQTSVSALVVGEDLEVTGELTVTGGIPWSNITGAPSVSSDAETLDSYDSSAFPRKAENAVITGSYRFNNNLAFSSSNGQGIKFWNDDDHKIYMSNSGDGTYGGRLDSSSDYNIYFNISDGINRGFVLKNNGNVKAQIDGAGKGYFNGLKLTNDSDITGVDVIQGYNDLRFFGDAGTMDMKIDTSGRVGIGGAAASERFEVIGGDFHLKADTPRIRVVDTGESSKWFEMRYESGWARLYTDSGSSNIYTDRMIRADGGFNVDGKWAISDTNAYHAAQYTDNTQYGYFEFLRNDGQRGGYIGQGVAGSYLSFVLENGNDLYIGGGDVGIGTSTPAAKLDVNGSFRVSETGSLDLPSGSIDWDWIDDNSIPDTWTPSAHSHLKAEITDLIVGNGGLTQNNFTNALLSKLNGIQAGATNQDLSLSDNTLSISNSSATVDLTSYVNTDNQELSLSGDTLSLSGSTATVSLAAYARDTDKLDKDNGTATNLTVTGTVNLAGKIQIDADGNMTIIAQGDIPMISD